MMNRIFRSNKVIIVLICVLVAVAAAFFMFGLNRVTKLQKFQMEQIGNVIAASWQKENCDKYKIQVFVNDRHQKTFYVKKNSFRVGKIKAGKSYKIIVTAISDGKKQEFREETVVAKKVQKIETVVDSCNGFEREKFNLKARAAGQLSYSSDRPSVASADETGEVYLHAKGTAKIRVDADETDQFARSIKYIDISIYPHKLKSIKISRKYTDAASVKLSWNKVAYAQKYQLLKYSLSRKKYVTYEEYPAGSLDVTLAREDSSYIVKAVSDVHGTHLESKSEECKVSSDTTDARSYGSLKVIKTLGNDDLSTVAKVSGVSRIRIPQSMCFNGKDYVVAFINRGNSRAILKSYNHKGRAVSYQAADGVRHANGCTYNPHTDKIYVCPTYASYKERELVTFDGSSFDAKGKVSLSRAPSGIAYDSSNNSYYAAASQRLYVMDSKFNIKKTIIRKRWKQSQDVGAYNGVALSCIWTGGKSSYIDMYRVKDSAYIGSYKVPLGEIESVCIDDGYLVILMHKGQDTIYKTKERLSFSN